MDANKGLTGRARLLPGLLAFLMGSFALAPAYGSDTEVYAREVDFSGDVTPVLMMVLDSSGSMLDCLENCTTGSTNKLTRIGALRQAMKKVLFGDPEPVSGGVVKPAPDFIKMGYARFNPDANDGGWMRYPAMKLSDTVPDSWIVGSTVENSVQLIKPPTTVSNDVSGSDISSTTFKVGSTMSALGLRFTDLQIPRNAKITGAQLHFTASSGTVPSQVKVAVEQTGNAAAFDTNGTSGRTWSSDSTLSTQDGATTFYLDVTSLVQDRVSNGAWCGGNAMSFRVTAGGGSKTATVISSEGSTTTQPQLIVSYTTKDARTGSCIAAPIDVVLGVRDSLDDIAWPDGGGSASVSYREPLLYPAAVPDDNRNLVALRFNSVPVFQGADIDKAWLYVTSARTDAVAASVSVAAFNADTVPPFCKRDATTKVVTCTPPDTGSLTSAATLSLPANASGASTDGVHRAINVTAQVKAVIDRAGWLSGNSLGFLLQNPVLTSSNSSLYSVDSTLSKGAFLHIVYRKKFENLDDINKTARQDLYDDINARMYASGGTPLGDAYAEAGRYMLGIAPYSYDTFTTTFDGQIPSQTYTQPDPRTVSGTNYASPMENISECSANYVYLMSDGEPNNASNVNNDTKGVVDGYNKVCADYSKIPTTSGNTATNFSCMMALAYHLSSGVNQKKAVIRTNSVLFADDVTGAVVNDFSSVAEDYGKGQFFHAKTSSQLTDSLLKTMTSLLDQTGSITAPGVAVNQFNRLNHLDQLYYAVFDPDAGHARWRGNVKRYKLLFQDIPMADGTTKQKATIVDRFDKPAIDPATTFFSTDATSFWSTVKDGNNAVQGGSASMLPDPATRTIYTYTGTYGAEMGLSTLDAVPVATGKTLMGFSADGQWTNVKNWLKGYSLDIIEPSSGTTPASIKTTAAKISGSTLVRNEMGGVLHSQPVLVNYGYTSTTPEAAAEDASKQDNMVFFSTMEGLLHAVDANTGIEKFAFIPKEKLQRVDEFIINDKSSLPEFGMDSTWTILRVDGNKDFKITTGGDDKMWLFGGMRMGGRNYYALDATNRNSPVLKWVKQGGVDANFTTMGQTWSQPVLGDVKIGGTVKTVLFFAGGYDDKHELAGYTTDNLYDTKGNQLYVVDPANGDLLFWASSASGANLVVPAMKFSITAKPKLFDANKDGLVDSVYFGDLGGQVFRLDLNNAAATGANLGVRVRRLANLGQGVTADTFNQRRFYEAPSVAVMFDDATQKPYVMVAMGSGYRSHPLDLNTEDFFYALRDDDALRPDLATADASSLQATILPSHLANVDLNTAKGVDMTGKMGWKLDLPATGEKVLATPMLLLNEVIFTTYVPGQDNSGAKCKPVIGQSNEWRFAAADAAASRDLNGDGVIDEKDRFIPRIVDGLGGEGQLLVGKNGQNAVLIGTGATRNQDLTPPGMRRTRWYQK